MSPPQFRKITNGVLALSLVDTLAVGYSPDWQTPGGVDIDTVTAAAYTDGPTSDSWACQATESFVSASANTTSEDVPDGWCGPGSSTTNVKESTFALNITWVQDEWDEGGGLSGWAYDHDAQEAYFLVQGDNVTGGAKLAGRCWIIAGQIFGTANSINTSTAVWNCDKKPLSQWPAVVVAAAKAKAPKQPVTADA